LVHDACAIAAALRDAVQTLHFAPPVTHVYHPLAYAWPAHTAYLTRYARPCEILLVGMNPGPFGMAQTGIPFGDVSMVRDWLGITAPVQRPPNQHPKRPITGFDCPRGEVSGRRLWGWARTRFQTPERFFARFFVHNYCPAAFMDHEGRNLTPDKLPATERAALHAPCDHALRNLVALLNPRCVIGIGHYAETRIHAALADTPIHIGRVPHPSPASPAANRGWDQAMDAALAALGISP
jgi:single-strand selective monofunctional uracil DNA glycosylase